MSNSKPLETDNPLIIPLAGCKTELLPLVGGKGANLGELMRAKFPVPDGFCVTTAAYTLAAAHADLESVFNGFSAVRVDDVEQLSRLAALARGSFSKTSVPANIISAVREAYHQMTDDDSVPVAIRSSATAEDLPTASFAGQQETYLNVVGTEAVLDAIRRCWESLWTDRAVSYRANKGIDPRGIQLAVIVQRMVDAEVAGVLFTANPVTGRRQQVVINASFGLGESVVSGLVNPDHFVVNSVDGEIIERRLGDKRLRVQALPGGGVQQEARENLSDHFSLTDEQIKNLAELGRQVKQHFGSPQDIEWALDSSGNIWLTQARPITTLFPLPTNAPAHDDVLRVYLSFNVQQGSHKPFTPAGIAATRLLTSTIMAFIGFPLSDPLAGPGFVREAAFRIFFDVTGALRSSFGRKLLIQAMAQAEAQASAIFEELVNDPRLSLLPISRPKLLRTVIRLLVRTRALWYLPQTLLSPQTGRARLFAIEDALRQAGQVEMDSSASDCLTAVDNLFDNTIPRLLPAVFPVMLGAILSAALSAKLLGDCATPNELQIVLRGLPFNPTTEMTLALWGLAQKVQSYPEGVGRTRSIPTQQLTEDYLQGNLPSIVQEGLSAFLSVYGHRSVNELDMGEPRWSENPAYIFGLLASYLDVHDPARTPDAQYRDAVQEAEMMVAELSKRARQKSWLRGLLAGFFLKQARALGGLREMPRDVLALMLAQARLLLRRVGQALVQAEVLEQSQDIFFLSLIEARAALSGTDFRTAVAARREKYEQECARRRVPLVLLSDGTEPAIQQQQSAAADNALRGVPASPGVATAPARVIFDPQGVQFARGDILVAPSTDPGWTPLFLMAGGLVVETGGEMSHGAIVAREYGIPAVVGVAGATERIRTGQQISVDGSTGVIQLAGHNDQAEPPQSKQTG